MPFDDSFNSNKVLSPLFFVETAKETLDTSGQSGDGHRAIRMYNQFNIIREKTLRFYILYSSRSDHSSSSRCMSS